jgi:hypothetical protein
MSDWGKSVTHLRNITITHHDYEVMSLKCMAAGIYYKDLK